MKRRCHGRIDEILRIQRIATTQTLEAADLQRQAFITHLVTPTYIINGRIKMLPDQSTVGKSATQRQAFFMNCP